MGDGGVHVPPHLRRFLEVTLGFSWPESDDQGLTALWLAWAEFEKTVTAYQAAVAAAGRGAGHALAGDTGEFFSDHLTGAVGDSLAALAEGAGELGTMAQTAAADVYKTKVMFVVFAAFALATIIELLASLIGALFTAPVIAAARISLAAIWKALVTRLATLTRPLLLRGLAEAAEQTAKFTVIGVGLMAGTDFGVQAQQIADGLRDTWDTRSLTASAISGALGGAFAGLFHAGAGLMRSTAFTLEGRLVTTGVTTAFTGLQKALGHLLYGTGQVGIALLTAPLINTLTGHPGANPFLGIITAFSAHGGPTHTAPTHTTPPTLTIPTTVVGPPPVTEKPPAYTATDGGSVPKPGTPSTAGEATDPTWQEEYGADERRPTTELSLSATAQFAQPGRTLSPLGAAASGETRPASVVAPRATGQEIDRVRVPSATTVSPAVPSPARDQSGLAPESRLFLTEAAAPNGSHAGHVALDSGSPHPGGSADVPGLLEPTLPEAPVTAAAASLVELGVLPAAPPAAVAEIRDRLDHLRAAADTTGRRPFEPLLGPDLFGLGRTPETPAALRGLDFDALSAAQGVTLLERLDLTRPLPPADQLTPEALAEGRPEVHVSAWTEADERAWEHEGLDWDNLPPRRETPQLLHGIWLGGPLADDGIGSLPLVAAADFEGTASLTAKVIQTLVRELANRQGDLHLTEVMDVVLRHEIPAAVWSAAIGYLADTPSLRERVRTVTIDRFHYQGLTTVALPPDAASLLVPRAGERVEYLGETVVPVTLRSPSGGGVRPVDAPWPAPLPERDLAEAVLAKRSTLRGGPLLPELPDPRHERSPQLTAVPPTSRPPRPDAPELVLDDPVDGKAPNAEQANALAELARYLAEQSILRANRGFSQPSVELRAAGETRGAEQIRTRLTDLLSRHTTDATAPAPAIHVRQSSGVAEHAIELRVDWELRGTGLPARGTVETTPPATTRTITTDRPPAPHPVLDDHAWRRSPAATAEWMTDPAPLTRAELDADRDRATVTTVHAEVTGPRVLDLRPGAKTGQWRHPIAYDYRRYEARPGKWVQEYTVRLNFTAPRGFELPRYLDHAQTALDSVYNHQYRVPTGDAFHLRVQHDPTDSAHGTITVTAPGSKTDQLHWPTDIDPLVVAHEIGHFTGLHDEYVRLNPDGVPWALRGPGSTRVAADDGLFTSHLADYLDDLRAKGRTDLAVPSVKPRNLWLVEHLARTLGATTGISSGHPARTGGAVLPEAPGETPVLPTPADAVASLARLSDELAQAQRHMAALPPDFDPRLRAGIDARKAVADRVTVQDLTPLDVAGLPNQMESATRLNTFLREARLRQMHVSHDAAVAKIERDENPLRYHPAGIPGGVTSSPDARFGLEIEFQLLGDHFAEQIGVLGQRLEEEGIIDWKGGQDFHRVATDPTRWTLVNEDAHDAGVELRSPILPGGTESWTALATALRVIRSHRNADGDPPDAGRVGGHVNVSFAGQPALSVYGRLAQLDKVFEDNRYRLGNHYGRDAFQRHLANVGPNPLPLALSDIKTPQDIRALNFDKFDALSFRNVTDTADDRVEFRSWAGGLDETVFQIHAELSGLMRLAAEDPSLDRRLLELLPQPRLVGHTPAFTNTRDELSYLLDFLELLPMNRATEELVVASHAWTRPLAVTDENDSELRAQTIVGPGGRGWYFPPPGCTIREAVAVAARFPHYPTTEIVAADLTTGRDEIDLWIGDPISFDDFADVVAGRDVLFRAKKDGRPSARLVLAVENGATGLGRAMSLAMQDDEAVVATEGRVWITEEGRLMTDTEWLEFDEGRVRVHSGRQELGAALESIDEQDTAQDG
ncbi:hypothetical protein DMC64_36885 [Amycolatopsis sp. WAC 04197]|uniref:WXG100-like domain-containing protein n=1 Tax=Amycolatopsis sp. WAC 04197 TaxID=2203199 RepID=UPI000F78FDD5|nr:hypothetical protein [Amycolatopsis sp. WAC 04197]RSN39901.1 hypothetical protein DMC64_36885 [Amycolatopsis sp. WAC 04197]